MSTNGNIEKMDVSPERIDEIMKRAHRERAEAIQQLFGFGFSVVKDAVKSTFGRRGTKPIDRQAGNVASFG